MLIMFSKNLLPRGVEPHSSVGSVQDLRKGVLSPGSASQRFFPRIDDSHCDRIHSSLTSVYCFDDGWLCRRAASGWPAYCAEYWLKELQESMDSCTFAAM